MNRSQLKKTVILLSIFFIVNISAEPKTQLPATLKNGIIDVSFLGFSESNSAEENGKVLEKLSDFVSNKHDAVFSIPKGFYHVVREVSNQVSFKNCRNVIVDGNGAKFIFQDTKKNQKGNFFLISKCENFTLQNICIDWNWDIAPLSAVGRIKEVSNTGILYELLYGGVKILPPIHMGREWDSALACRSPKGFALPSAYFTDVTKIDDEHIFLKMKYPERLNPSDEGKCTHIRFQNNYFVGAVYVENSKSIVLDNIIIYSSPETAFSCYGSHNLTIQNCKIMPYPGTNHFYSSHSAGEIHNNTGEIIYRDNQVIYNYDDGLHISNGYIPPYLTKDSSNAKVVIAAELQYYFMKDVICMNDEMEFYHSDFSPSGFKAKLTNVKWNFNVRNTAAANDCVLTFDREIPDSLIKNHFIFNTRLSNVKYSIINNSFKYGSCHGIYSGLPNGIIQGNTFYRLGYPAVIVGLILRWGRWVIGPSPCNLKITDNTIDECNTANRQPGCMFVGAGFDPQNGLFTSTDYHVAKNIEITNNVIKNTDMPALVLWSAENVKIQNNTFINVARKPIKEYTNKGGVYIEKSAKVLIENNTMIQDSIVENRGLVIDEKSSRNISVKHWVQECVK